MEIRNFSIYNGNYNDFLFTFSRQKNNINK